MKIPLKTAIKKQRWCIVEGEYTFESLDYKKFSYKIRPISFEKIDEASFNQNNEAKRLLEIGDLYLLEAEIENLSNKIFDSFAIEKSLILKNNFNKEFYTNYDDVLDSVDRYNLSDFINDYLKNRELFFLTYSSSCSSFSPNIIIKGGIIFLLPKNDMESYYLSVASDEFSDFRKGKIFEEIEENEFISDQGWIYALINPSMPQNLVKIGMTNRNPEKRVKELSSKTAVPTPFQIIFKKEVTNYEHVEKLIHDKLGKYRYQRNKEFFKVPTDKLIPFLEKICSHFPPKDLPSPEEIIKQKKIKKIETEIQRLKEELINLKGTE
jgi:hypothetical protein